MSKKNPNAWVFLSHSNKDFERVTPIRNKLEKLNYRPLLFYLKCLEDQEELEDLIKREIDARERFILCKSRNIEDSDWVKKEMDYIQSTGRPYEIIDLDASKAEREWSINRFDQRSTIYVISTEDDVVGKLLELLAAKALKVNTLPFVKIITPSDVSMLKGAYFLLLVTRNLNKEEVELLNQLVERYRMDAVAYKLHGRRTTKPASSIQSTMLEFKIGSPVDNNGYYDGWNDLDENKFHKECIEETRNTSVAETIVKDLMNWDKDWDKRHKEDITDNKKPKKQSSIDKNVRKERVEETEYPSAAETIVEKLPVEEETDKLGKRSKINIDDFVKRLKAYIDEHRGGTSLNPIDKFSHKNCLKKQGLALSTQDDYLRRVNNKKLLDLINSHARKKDLCFATIYDCTDLETLLWTLEDLRCKGSAEAEAINDKHGSMSSALYYYILHLLKANDISII